MMLMMKIAILLGLTQFLRISGKPILTTGIFVSVVFFLGLISFVTIFQLLVSVVIAAIFGILYFGLLFKFESSWTIWLTVLILGIFIYMFIL